MNKTTKPKTASLVILLITAFAITSLAGLQFVSKVTAAYTETIGTLDGVPFIVRFPDNWNGMLFVFCRGYSATPVPNTNIPQYNQTATTLLGAGFAVAASTFGVGGYCYMKGMNSTYQLTKYIVETYHVTGKVFLYGISMGSCIALMLGEKYPTLYSGVLDQFGPKDLKAQYELKARWANLSDAELAAELTALTIPVPPAGYANLTAFKNFIANNKAGLENETGGTPSTNPKAYEDRSPLYHANITIPVITVHGTSDAIVPYYESINYQAAVAKAGRSNLYRLYTVVGGGHGGSAFVNQFLTRVNELVAWSEAIDGWTMTVDGRSLKAYSDLKEYVWQKNASMPPNGQYDKVGLHRLVKAGVTPKGVVFLTNCPMWGAGEQRISNPASDNWTKTENASQAIYWANRGFDVYAIDYRTHFVPKTLNASQSSFTGEWGLDVWLSDIKEAAEKVKQVSGADKFFISGECSGGMLALNYATKYWKTDLKGIILLDPNFFSQGYPVVGRINETNTYNLTAAVNTMYAISNFTLDPYAALRPIAAYALENPAAPAQYPLGNPLNPPTNPATNQTWANITEWWTFIARNLSVMGNTGNITQVEKCFVDSEWLPTRLVLEAMVMTNWVNSPYLTYDYNDHYNEIGVPLLAFDSGLFSNRTGALRFVNGINNTDFTAIMLPTYGHLDVYMGTNSVKDVSQPALVWMLNELGLTPKATAFGNVTIILGSTWPWYIYVHSTGGVGTHTCQWYEGTTLLTGQTSTVLAVTKSAPGTYTYYCKITDAEGTTTNSNNVTLTVAT